jgi:hypothetical protein
MGFHADSARIRRRFHASRMHARRAVPSPYPVPHLSLGTNPLVISGPRWSFQPHRRTASHCGRDQARSTAPRGPGRQRGFSDAY